ncbi:STAS domain-containing protein [Eubacterium sp. AB3007]|uniref:STAS domain-containing protein n=1 Tax=Eubacterium sp. AB3007 TaxID=1392487 RepID=UPI000B0ACBE7|nr:STAS domain-containing protein [Eubacterium sp. AB3007]
MLNINKTQKDSTLTLALEGRLDTVTSPELDEVVKEALDGVTELVFDFTELQYISSAGLRVLLSAQKKMAKQGSMKILHVNETIMEIFEVTGFSEILTIEQ